MNMKYEYLGESNMLAHQKSWQMNDMYKNKTKKVIDIDQMIDIREKYLPEDALILLLFY